MHVPQSEEQVRQLITEQLSLPSPPAIAVKILNTVQKEDASMHDLAGIISADPALTAKLLQVANSGFYSLPNRIKNVEHALSVLGMNVIKNIALSFAIAGNLRGTEDSSFDFNYFWRRSVTSAVAAELVSTLLGRKDEDIFVTALLHEIGILVIFQGKGEEYNRLLKERLSSDFSLIELERQRFGYDHQLVGASLISDWKLPACISEPIRYHHDYQSAPQEYRKSAEILFIAGSISAIYSEADSAQRVRQLKDGLSAKFHLKEEDVRDLIDNVASQSIEILKTFDVDPGDIKPFSQMLQEANLQLGQLNLSYEQLVMELKEAKEKAELLACELREANSRLEGLVFRDGLTGLYNHRYFQEILAKELARSQRYHTWLSLLMFDIDFFKNVNDTYGHPVGDSVLMHIAGTATGAVRSSDVVARYGGEEFAVILPGTDQSGLKVFAERLRRSIEMIATEAGGKHIRVTVSVGGTAFDPEYVKITKKLLVETADKALYMSKNNGRNRVTVLNPAGG